MSSRSWERQKELFQAASALAPEQRPAFLDAACEGDAELRREVGELLSAHAEAGNFLSRPIGLDGALEPPDAPRRIGPYRVLDTIAQGGMGTVYRAVRDDDAFRKTVALKLVRGRRSDAFERRFRQEREILARLQHPNVATVLDGGTTEDGQPYLVMEFLDGQPITEYCAARGLSTRARVALFRSVCDAVQYAHQNLVVHRDIKPGNVLVDAHGVPKLLDFGIAKLLAAGVEPETAPTATVLPLMTPEYASPEQVRGQAVTTASDVYSLGVLLYELLAGRRPYVVPTESLEGIVRAVCETEPVLPSDAAARPELRGDLDTIVRKTLRKEPERRYLTAHELSEDLRRHLEGLPVTARADTLRYRAAKFVRRNRTAVAAAVLVTASLVGGIVATTRQARVTQRRFEEARRLIRTVVFDIQPKLGAVAGTTPLRKDLVESTLSYLEALARDAGDDPALLRELVSSYVQLARVQGIQGDSNVGSPEAARATLGRAQELVERLLAIDPRGPDSLHEAAVVERHVALGLLYQGSYAPAQEHARRAIALAERQVAARPDFQAREDLADAHRTLANSADSVQDFERSRVLYESLLAERPDAATVQRNLSQVHKYLAGLHYRKGQYREGLALIGKARAIDDALLARDPGSTQAQTDLTFSLTQQSWGHAQLGEFPAALAASQQALALRETIAARDPENARAREQLAYAYRARGRVRRQMADRAAHEDYERAHAIYTALRERGYGGAYVGSELGVTKFALGEMAEEQGRRADACRWYRESAAVYGALAEAVLPNHKEDAENARRRAEACGR